MPAYNAAATLARTFAELDLTVVDEVVLVDDASKDDTITLARELGLEPIRHERNLGYGGNQKTCYRRALDLGAEIIVMVHPDYQYSPLLVPAMASMIAYGEYDMILGSRILAQNSVARGMPLYKYASNRVLTAVENLMLQQKLSEYHTGLRAPSTPACSPGCRSSATPTTSSSTTRSSPRQSPRAHGSASCPARPATRKTHHRSTCAAASGTASACCAPAPSAWLHKRGIRKYPYLELDPSRPLTALAPPAGNAPPARDGDEEQIPAAS